MVVFWRYSELRVFSPKCGLSVLVLKNQAHKTETKEDKVAKVSYGNLKEPRSETGDTNQDEYSTIAALTAGLKDKHVVIRRGTLSSNPFKQYKSIMPQ